MTNDSAKRDASKTHSSFESLLDTLVKGDPALPAGILTRFSDLEGEELRQMEAIWPNIPADRRAILLADLFRLQEEDTLLSFENFARYALADKDPRARINAIRLLKECKDTHLIPKFTQLLEQDPESIVRAAAAEALGNFIYLGELEEIPPDRQDEVEESLMRIIASKEPAAIREKALESLGYSSREEVKGLIQNAFISKEISWVCSALTAMGRSADDAWSPQILEKIHNSDPRIQVCAVRSAGELELAEARQPLIELVEEIDELDSDVAEAVILSLSEIGGPGARDAIEALQEAFGEGENSEFFDQVMENLDFSDQYPHLDLFDLFIDDVPEHGDSLDEEEI